MRFRYRQIQPLSLCRFSAPAGDVTLVKGLEGDYYTVVTVDHEPQEAGVTKAGAREIYDYCCDRGRILEPWR
jgi:hypothetical protein